MSGRIGGTSDLPAVERLAYSPERMSALTPSAPWGSTAGPAPKGLPLLAISTAVWAAVATVMVAAMYADAQRANRPRALLALAMDYFPYFLPMILFSWLMARWLSQNTAVLQSASALGRAWALGMLVFLPLNAAFNALVTLWRQGRSGSTWWQHLSGYTSWTDGMIASGAFFALVAWMGWRERRIQEAHWQQTQGQMQKLRLHLLQGQLEPHFLFNALNSVSALVRAGDRGVALSSLAQVSELLRYALRASRADRVSLAEEVQFAQRYLQVQGLRFGPALQVHWELPAKGLDEASCPPLLLQPLIENAVRHGLEAHEGRGFVSVVITFLPDQRVKVRIENNLGASASSPGHGLGLQATQERLQLLFADQAQLRTRREVDRFVACLMFPCMEPWGELERTDR